MNIVVIGRSEPIDHSSYGLFEYEQAQMLAARGNSVAYLYADNRSIKSLRRVGAVSRTDGALRVVGVTLPAGGLPYGAFSKIKTRCLRRALRQLTEMGFVPDVVYAHFPLISLSEGFLSVLEVDHVPVVCVEHWSKVLNKTIDKKRAALLERLVECSAAFCCVSEDLARSVCELTGCTRDAVRVVPNAIPTEHFHPGAVARVIEDDEPFTFIWSGRIEHVKRVDKIIEALACIESPARLLIVGEGGDKSALEERARALGLGNRVLFLGWKSPSELADLYRVSDCYLSSSKTETFCAPIAEAWLSGIPCIAPSSNPLRGYFTEGNGALFDVDNDGSLVRAMRAAIARRSEFDGSSIAMRARELFSDDAVMQDVQEILRAAALTSRASSLVAGTKGVDSLRHRTRKG